MNRSLFFIFSVFIFSFFFNSIANTHYETNTIPINDASLTEHGDSIDDVVPLSLTNLFNLQVVTSSRKTESRDEAPNVTYVITKEQIQQRGYKNIYELLQTIPGYVITIKNIGDYLAQVRGIAANDNEKITLMINGHSINNLQEPILLDGPINLDIVEKVEVIVGPGSVLYGANTLGSIVNIITKVQNKNELTLTCGPRYNHYNTTAMFAKRTDNANITGSLSFLHRDGWNAWPGKLASQLQGAGNKMGSKTGSYFGFVQAALKNWTIQGLTINDNDPELDLISSGGYKNARRFDYIDEVSVESNTFWTKNWGTNLLMEYDSKRMARVGTETNDTIAPSRWGNEYDLQQKTYKAETGLRFKTEWLYAQAGLQGQMDQNRHCYILRHTADLPLMGYDTLIYKINNNDTMLIYPNSSVNQIIKDIPTYTVGGYISGEFSPISNFHFTLACRFDHFSWLEDSNAKSVYFNPRLAVYWQPLDWWTTKAMYNRAAHTADFGGTKGMNQIWGLGNPDAVISPDWTKQQPLASKPEVMQSLEWQNIFYIPKTRIAINGYYTTLDDFITWFFPVSNTGDFVGYGAELEIISKPVSTLNLWANIAFNKTEFTPVDSVSVTSEGGRYTPVWGTTPENEIIGVPRITTTFGTDWEIINHLFFNPGFRFMYNQPMFKNGDFQTALSAAPDNLKDDVKSKKNDYWTHVDNFFLDLGISYNDCIFKGLDIGVIVKNVTNNQTEQSQSFNTGTNVWRGRTFDISARYAF